MLHIRNKLAPIVNNVCTAATSWPLSLFAGIKLFIGAGCACCNTERYTLCLYIPLVERATQNVHQDLMGDDRLNCHLTASSVLLGGGGSGVL